MMKRRESVSLALLAIATALLIVTGHRADVVRADVGCGPALIKNSYGFALSGLFDPSFGGTPETIASFIPIAGAGTFTFDGGTTGDEVFYAQLWRRDLPGADSGTYTLNSNCTGSAVFPDSAKPGIWS